MDGLIQDLRYALRTLLRSPGFTLVAVVTLALSIGATTAIFGAVYDVLWRSLPYRDPGRLTVVWGTTLDGRLSASERERLRYRGASGVFAAVGSYRLGYSNLTGEGGAERVGTTAMDRELLRTLDVRPILGRDFTAEEDRPRGPHVALISYGLWQRRFAGRATALGAGLDVDGVRSTVVGVLPAGFRLPTDFTGPGADVYQPLALGGAPDPDNIHYLTVVGRLAPRLSLAAADRRLAVLSAALKQEIPSLPPTFEARLTLVLDEVVGAARPALLGLVAAVGLLLLIACTNVAGLMLVRAEARGSEMAIRATLGAGRARLVRQLLTEGCVLAAAGGLLGFALADWGAAVLAGLRPASLPRFGGAGLGAHALAVCGLLVALAAAVTGFVPAWRLRRRDLRPGGAGIASATDPAARRVRDALVAGELAFAIVLAAGAGLLARSMARLRDVDPGYAAPRALTAQLSLPSQRYPSPASARRFLEAVLEGVGAVPGVEAVGATSWLPLSGLHGDWGVRIAGREEERLPSGRRPWADLVVVTDGYFHALGARLEGGRLLTPGDDSSGAPVVMVNGTMARAYWGSAGAVGQRFRLSTDVDGGVYRAVVGVVADIKQAGLDGEPRPTMYLPGAQFPAGTGGPIATVSLVVRSRGDPDGLVRPVRAVVARVDPEVPVSGVATLEELRRESTSVRRFAAGLFDAFALAALLLVAVGVYGAVAYSVGLRRQELAMRLALGSTPAGIVRLVLSDGARLAAVGIVIGVAGAAAIGRLVRSLLFGIGPLDAATFAAAAAVVAGTTGIACWLPARRAMKVDPVQALRSE